MNSSLPAPPGSLPRGLRSAVTGGSAGIGEAICRLLNAQCATVFNLDLRKGSAGGAEIFIKTDVRSREIGRAHVLTPVTNAHLVCRLLLEQKKNNHHRPLAASITLALTHC